MPYIGKPQSADPITVNSSNITDASISNADLSPELTSSISGSLGANASVIRTLDRTTISGSIPQALATTSSPTFAAGTITGDLSIGGTLTAQEIHTEFESASILFTSGSTQFGNSSDDVHEFKGNTISGSVSSTGSFGSAHFMGTGGVGIGTNNPSYKLDIIENAETNVVRFFNDGGDQNRDVMILQGGSDSGPGNTRFITFNDGNGDAFGFIQGPADSATAGISFNTTADTSLLTLKGSSVGIGTNNPGSVLQVRVGSNQNLGFNSSSSVFRLSAFNDAVDANVPLIINASDLRFNNSDSEKMRITGGNVGIGTNNPSSTKFHVNGASGTDTGIRVTGGGYFASAIRYEDSDNSGAYFDIGTVSTSGAGNGRLEIRNQSGTPLVDIDNSGKVGIGNVPSPAEPLHVSGSDNGIRIQARSGTRGTLSFTDASGNIEGKIMSNGNGDLRIGGGSTANDDIIIENDGTVNFAGSLHLANGKGIGFSATTPDATGMSSELLDDYEEGVYDITIGGLGGGSVTMASSKNQLSYTKIGRQVTVQGEISIIGVSSLSGTMTINLPFSVGSTIGDLSSRTVGSFSSQNHNFNDFGLTIHSHTYENQSVMYFVYHKDNGTWEYVNTNTLASNTEFRVSLTYFTN